MLKGQTGIEVKRIRCLLANFLLSLWLCGSITGCLWWQTKEPERTPQGLYENGLMLMGKKKYEKAAGSFKKVKEEFPLSKYTVLAELKTADAYFLDKNYVEAVLLYEEFKKLHPTHAEVPYVIHQLGMCHYKQMRTLDRDQTETEKAIEQFRYLIENFPQSPHAAEARTKMELCRKQLAEHEFYIGNFYFRGKKYRAALGRYEGILQKYPGTKLDDPVKRLITECQGQIAKQEQKRKEKEAKEEKKKKEREEKISGKKSP